MNLMLSLEYIVQEYKYSEVYGSHECMKEHTVLGPWVYCLNGMIFHSTNIYQSLTK